MKTIIKKSAETMQVEKRADISGSALLTTTGVMVVVMLAVGSLATYVLSSSHGVRRMAHVVRARAIAEAGANRAYDALRADFSLRGTSLTNLFPQTTFGGGHYTVQVEPAAGGFARVISTGHSGGVTHSVGVDLRDANYGSGLPPFLEYAIFSNGAMQINGTPKEVNGDLQTNGPFVLNGDYSNVNGKIFAPNSTDVPEEHRGNWTPIPFPQLWEPEFQAFLAAADEEGILTEYSGDQVFRGDHSFDGITVVDGAVTFRGSGTREINGLLYVSGSVTVNGSTELSGALLVGGSITINGASAVMTHQGVGGSQNDPYVVVAGWWD